MSEKLTKRLASHQLLSLNVFQTRDMITHTRNFDANVREMIKINKSFIFYIEPKTTTKCGPALQAFPNLTDDFIINCMTSKCRFSHKSGFAVKPAEVRCKGTSLKSE